MARNYFLRANTCEGLVNLWSCRLDTAEKIYLLNGEGKRLKNKIISQIGGSLAAENEIEYILSPFDTSDTDAALLNGGKIAVLDAGCLDKNAELPHSDRVRSIELSDCIRAGLAEEEIRELHTELEAEAAMLYADYAEAKKIHDKWEKIYISNMKLFRLNSFCEHTLKRLFDGSRREAAAESRFGFFGASAPEGTVCFTEELTETIGRRYFIKGRPGTGKSTFLKKIAHEAKRRGFDTEVYYCSFDPKSLDMVLVPELDFCVFDSTAPHELFPTSERDYILDFYAEAGLEGADEKYAAELEAIRLEYAEKMSGGVKHLAAVRSIKRKIDEIYAELTDFEYAEAVIRDIIEDIKEPYGGLLLR